MLIDDPVPELHVAVAMNKFELPNSTDRLDENESCSSSVILSAETAGRCNVLKRRHIPRNVDQEHEESPINTRIEEENDEWKKKPHFERRRMFNLAKHVISIVLIILDLVFDWVQYSEMNKTGNYTIAAERNVKNIEFTIECEGTGKPIQFIFLIFTIVATILSVIQILRIIYQMFHEIKGVTKYTKNNLEYVETFVFLFFIEISQIMLIMGFYDVCTLDCTVNSTEILIALNGLFSFFKISWRLFTSCKCCTVYWKTPIRQTTVQRRPIRTRRRKRDCCDCDSKVGDPERAHNKRNCEQSCKCCILRCCPEPDTEACDCTCKQCLSCEQSFKCCIVRWCPTKLSPPTDDVFECKCGECLSCERNCRCCLLRCCPSHLNPPQFEVCTCSCRECLACTMSCCPCFTCRCFPAVLKPPHPDICTCRCRECLSCHLPCKCFSFRCFPEVQKPPKSNWFECTCGKCLSCEQNCCCCIIRCCPSSLRPPRFDVFECKCKIRVHPLPVILQPIKTPPPQRQATPHIAVISTQPRSVIIPQSRPIFIQKRKQKCENCNVKCINFLVAVLILFVIVLYLFYLLLLVVEIQFVFDCVEDERPMLLTQKIFVQNYLKLLNI